MASHSLFLVARPLAHQHPHRYWNTAVPRVCRTTSSPNPHQHPLYLPPFFLHSSSSPLQSSSSSPLRPRRQPRIAGPSTRLISTSSPSTSPFSLLPVSRPRSTPRSSQATTSTPSILTAAHRHCSSHRRAAMCRYAEATDSGMDVSQGRDVLPTNVKPSHYHLTLEPNFETFKFEGEVTIDLDVRQDTNSITLHCLEIVIHETRITSGDALVVDAAKVSYKEDDQTATITFDKMLPAGSKAKLYHRFTGELNDKMAGFYRSAYTGSDGKKKWMACTQFEATDCRRALPCFDEPALKATFDVTLIADHDQTCLGNADVANERDVDSAITGSKRKAVTFNTTPPMSTYLLAFIISELKVIESNAFRLPVRVFCTPDHDIEHGRYSLELGARTLEFYEKAFGQPYPLPKMDMVAIPDFSAGAMENWGLVTYRIVDLLVDDKLASAGSLQRVAEVVQHELAHQWFGNLVTMDFWDGLWLNEGFATWMSWYSCNVFYPEWKVWQSYVTGEYQNALSLDSLRSSHPIEVPVKSADQVSQIFDAISYSKGSAVIRMISKYLGEDVFMEGIRRYLKKHAYGNTRTEDLWAALSDASGKDVVHLADIWTKKIGYPVVTVTEKDGSLNVTQNRFLRTADVKPEEDKTLYPVVLGLRTKEGVDSSTVLEARERSFPIPSDNFFKINADHSGIFRTAYTPQRLRKLGEDAKAGLLSVEDRTGLVSDAGALSAAGHQKTSGMFSLFQGFKAESQFVVWEELLGRLGSLRAAWIFEEEKTKDALRAFQLDLVAPKAEEVGWTFQANDGHIDQQFKALLFGSAAAVGDEKVKAAAFDMFARFDAGDRSAIHPNLRSSVLGAVLQHGGVKEYDAVVREYEQNAPSSDERNMALRTLGRARSPSLIQRTLAYAMGNKVKEQDTYMPIMSLLAHREGIEAVWSWMQENWDALNARLPPTMHLFGQIVGRAASSFTHLEHRDAINKFFESHSTKGFDQSVAQALDSIAAKAGWLQRDKADVEAWLKEAKYL